VAVMIALETMRTAKIVANPSTVRMTCKARMTELTCSTRHVLRGDWTSALCVPDARPLCCG
jgi:hypothetical protein